MARIGHCLGLHFQRLRKVDFQPLLDKIRCRLAGWKCKNLLSHHHGEIHPISLSRAGHLTHQSSKKSESNSKARDQLTGLTSNR
ncbi:hypothetical protein BRADI_3g17753v3 [Brachypodium distachyon]|uniref:Uncharacterized protein n=1 Tax=Brachypodium distachyon TaxID=15368 RepID=A0A2K2CXX7_BRADI|nr:hypothetical protein BRADI_3g17753v3 [Brachypodium distachyon]